jgi:hypothetical protein
MGPDEIIFRQHLGADAFLTGEARGRWRLCGEVDAIVWPNAVFWIRARTKFVGTGGVNLRLDLHNYPQSAPTGCPWNVDTNSLLEPSLWPKGGGNVSKVFNPNWNRTALYAPCDRAAMINHQGWSVTHPGWWWTPSFTFVRYLEFVHICLNPASNEEDRP